MRIARLVIWILGCQMVGMLGARWTAREIPAWYATLVKPSFNPPNWIFGPVWTALYLLMAIAAWRVTEAAPSTGRTVALTFFAVQLVLHLAWPWIFFSRHALWPGFVEIVLMWLAIGATTFAFARISSSAAALMAPYWAWVTFATVLNGAVARLNPPAL